MRVTPPKSSPLTGKPHPTQVPGQLRKGDYVVCYDIRERRRLQRIQRLTAKRTIYLQRSVYLYRGQGSGLLALLENVRKQMEGDDDLRVYNLSHIRDMWFLSDDKPAIPEMQRNQEQTVNLSWWQRLLGWMRSTAN